jgi:hypothetical protein
VTDQPRVCLSCGKPADVEIETILHPLTARGERMRERIMKLSTENPAACSSCLLKVGEAAVDGQFAEEEP